MAVSDLQRFLCLLPLPCLYLRNVNLWKILLLHLVNELVSAQHCLLPHLCLVHNMKLIAFSERHAGSGLNGEFGI